MQKQCKNGTIFYNKYIYSAKLVYNQPICVIPLSSNECTFASENKYLTEMKKILGCQQSAISRQLPS